MVYEVKNRIEDETIKINYCNNDLAGTDIIEGRYFGLPIYKKIYPSCYQYNVLIMLAKRLIKEEERACKFSNRFHPDNTLTKKIISSEK